MCPLIAKDKGEERILRASVREQRIFHRFACPVKQKQFFDILPLLAKCNIIFSLYGAFLENDPKKQNFPFPHIALQCICGEGGWGIFPFFLQPSCTKNVLFLWSRALPFRQMGGTIKGRKRTPIKILLLIVILTCHCRSLALSSSTNWCLSNQSMLQLISYNDPLMSKCGLKFSLSNKILCYQKRHGSAWPGWKEKNQADRAVCGRVNKAGSFSSLVILFLPNTVTFVTTP